MCRNSERWVFTLAEDYTWRSGLPMLPKTYRASLVHDTLYQFLLDGLPFTRAEADGCFLRLMNETGFTLRRIYWLFVRVLGVILLHRKKRGNKGTREVIGPADLAPAPQTLPRKCLLF